MFVKSPLFRSTDDGGGAPPPPPARPAPPTPPAPPPNDPPPPNPPAPPSPPTPPAPPPPPKWQDTWREDMAGTLAENASEDEKKEHEKLVSRLKRFNSPAEIAKAVREQDKLISSGALKKALPAKPTPEQLAEWRKDNGIPEEPGKYDITMPDGLVFGEEDKPVVDQILKNLHGVHATNEVVKAALKTYADSKAAASAATSTANNTARRAMETELRQEWGGEYDSNVDGITAMLDHQGEGYKDFLFSLRKPDGTQAMNDARFVRALAQEAREKGFMQGTIVPAGGDVGKSVDDQIKTLEDLMFKEDGSHNPAYWNDEKKQAQLAKLYDTRKRISARENA